MAAIKRCLSLRRVVTMTTLHVAVARRSVAAKVQMVVVAGKDRKRRHSRSGNINHRQQHRICNLQSPHTTS